MKKLTFYTSKLESIKDIKKKNEAFKALSSEDRRKEIAFDSLNLVLNNLTNASKGVYWGDSLNNMMFKSADSEKLQEKLLNIKQENYCEVCARGSMMLSTIRLGNNLNPRDFGIRCGGMEVLAKIDAFSHQSFHRMENEYEWNSYEHPHKNRTNQKLANICMNVIINGDFDVEDKKDYLAIYNLEI